MIIPFIFIFTLFFFLLCEYLELKIDRAISIMIVLLYTAVLSLVFTFRGLEHGWDTPGYIAIFDRINNFEQIFTIYNSEYFFWFINYMISLASANHYFFLFSLSLISLFFLLLSLSNISRKLQVNASLLLFILTLLSSSSFYLFITNGIRQSIAYSIFMYALSLRLNGRCYKYFIYATIAFFCHHSLAICMLALELSLRIKNIKYLLVSIVLSAFLGLIIMPYILPLLGLNSLNGINQNASKLMLIVKLIVHFILLVFFSYFRKYNRLAYYDSLLSFYSLIGAASWCFFSLTDTSERILLYSSYIECILFVFVYYNLLYLYKSDRSNSLIVSTISYLMVIFYFTFIYMNSSIQFTLGNLAL